MFKLFPETFLIQFYLAHMGEAKTVLMTSQN